MNRAFVITLILILFAGSIATAATLTDSTGVLRVFGDRSSWMSTCFVVGDGSWVITTRDAVTEKIGPDTDHTIRYPVFISSYTGEAHQCELVAQDKELNLALLKLPIKGLPAAPLAQGGEFSKAAYGTMGQLMSGDPIGNKWATDIHGITRQKSGDNYKLVVEEWDADKVFVTEIGKYHWVFLIDVNPATSIPNGSMVVHNSVIVGMYLNRLVIMDGNNKQIFGRCAISTAIARWLSEHGVDTTSLYTPPAATVARGDDSEQVFQLQAKAYSLIGAGRADLALDSANSLSKLRPNDAHVKMILGVALMGAGKLDDALKAYDEAAKLDSKLPALRTNRALALIALKKRDEAEKELLAAAEEAKGDVRPVSALADFYTADDKTLDKALTYARKVTSMAPESPAALLLLARVEKRQKDYQQSIDTIGQALKMANDWGEAWYALGATYEQAGDKTNAEKAYRKLAEKQPKNPGSLLTLASFLMDQGKTDDAAEIISKIRALNPPQPILDAVKALEEKTAKNKN
ncbi:MAG: tetratricopeptide repeat protein [Armatimonadota bacterium]|nr:tetratricopeptide repeat protein [bacterium]